MASSIYSMSAYTRTSPFMQRNSFASYNQEQKNSTEPKTTTEAQRLREMIRDLKRAKSENMYSPIAGSRADSFSALSGTEKTTSETEEEIQKASKYNFKEVANKILRAKTALSAGQAVISAKRKVVEVKRKMSSGDGDPEELQIALNHARRMEIAARKKKRHLEMEEMIVTVQKRDEKLERMEEAVTDIQSSVIDAAQEELGKQQDAIFEERKEMLDEVMEQQEKELERLSEEEMAELNEIIAEFGEEELQALQEMMELLDSMEIINPHMSKEDLEELKRKHRNEEYKAILKAEMDYLKDMIKYMQEKGMTAMYPGVPATGGNAFAMPAADFEMAVSSPEMSAPVGNAAPMSSINVRV